METPAASTIRLKNGLITRESEVSEIGDNNKILYDVFRIENGNPIFLHDHILRLYQGAKEMGYTLSVNDLQLKDSINKLLTASGALNGNIKLQFVIDEATKKELFYEAFFLPTNYPTALMYINGVRCTLLFRERNNPSVKVLNSELRGASDAIREQQQVYETLLVNHFNCITEGSRSNVFFVKNNQLVTASDEMVLCGIIRKKVLDIASKESISTIFKSIKLEELEEMEAAFITGTSPRILPIKEIDNKVFNISNPIVEMLMVKLNNLIKESCK